MNFREVLIPILNEGLRLAGWLIFPGLSNELKTVHDNEALPTLKGKGNYKV